MEITKLCFIILLVVASIFSMLFLFGCSPPMSSLESISIFGAGKGAINALAFSPDGKQLAVASSEGIRIYDTRTKKFTSVLTQERVVRALAWSDQGLASGYGSTIALWNVNTQKRYQTFDKGAEALGFIGNKKIFCVSYKYKSIDGWDIHTGNRVQDYPKSIPPSRSVTRNFGGDENRIVNAEPGAIVNLKKPIPGSKHTKRSDVPSAAAFAPNSTWALALKDVVSNNGEVTEGNVRVRVTPAGKKKTYYIAEKMKTPVTTMALSTDGNFLATGSRTEAAIQLWNVKTGKLLRILTIRTNGITALAFSRDRILASGSRDGIITLWEHK